MPNIMVTVVGGIIGAAIYAGIRKLIRKFLCKNKYEIAEKEVIQAVRDHMILKFLGGLNCKTGEIGGYGWKLKDGRSIQLLITIKECDENAHEQRTVE